MVIVKAFKKEQFLLYLFVIFLKVYEKNTKNFDNRFFGGK